MIDKTWLKAALDADQEVIVQKQFSGVVKGVDETARTARFVISTGDVDRDNDTIDPKGWKLGDFRKNPVVLWAHNNSIPPIGKAVQLSLRGGKELVATAQFARPDQHELAGTVFELIAGGFLNATSVGFQPLETVFNNERGGFDFKSQALHEFSVVPVPANPHALLTASKKVDTSVLKRWAEYTLDHIVSKEAEAVYRIVEVDKSQVDFSDLPEEVQLTMEMIDLDLPEVKTALLHKLTEGALETDSIDTFEGSGDPPEAEPQADGDAGEGNPEGDVTDPNLEDIDSDLLEQELDILDADSGDSGLGQGDDGGDPPEPKDHSIDETKSLDEVTPEELKAFLKTEVSLQVATVSGKLPE